MNYIGIWDPNSVHLENNYLYIILCSFQDFPWYPKPLNELTGTASVMLNESACLVLFTGMDLEIFA